MLTKLLGNNRHNPFIMSYRLSATSHWPSGISHQPLYLTFARY